MVTTSSSPLAPIPTSGATTEGSGAFQFPRLYSFPPFFNIQPVLSTRASQLASWSSLIQEYCRHHRIYTLTLVDALSTPLFNNSSLSRRLSLRDARAVIQWMTTTEGGNRAEWISAGNKKVKGEEGGEAGKCWIFWKKPEEWASALEEWVDRTGQKGVVLTLYEITESDATMKEEFYGMDPDLLSRSLSICVKRGKAQIFGGEGSEGVKFF
ncbi:ESCRT-II complex, vps25 subunit [Aaosphaeria arxii CBS 175.79]|uniref:Vacuolar protein-sorting-associated protein 25 n=1 Tax=Aaosphaeria arxii CBS 175.79 TaxID=1450172 RepID=A0A6A5Y087_9PLEO|nr:ESCRT-II complex, vps25 subunit [Aaosphaeria arxii CBS 175.79]KAF2018945.1 ESCRT-II complex, vps25 subunit [Aaosphaeria arxii CBS 175.79]